MVNGSQLFDGYTELIVVDWELFRGQLLRHSLPE